MRTDIWRPARLTLLRYDTIGVVITHGTESWMRSSPFTLWLEDCCEHENGEYCSEWIGTWGMYGVFQDAVEEAGGKEVLPLLGHMLPTANGGQYPVEKTEATLVEVEQFIRITRDECARGMAYSLQRLLLASLETRNPILWC